MIHRYILKTISGNAARFVAIIDRTIKGGKKYAITTDFEIVEVVNDILPKNVITIDFDKSTRSNYEITYDDMYDSQGIDKKKKEIIASLAQCKFVKPTWSDNPLMGFDALFSLEYINGKSISRVLRDRKVISAYNKWMSMNLDDKAQCAYYFGVNPAMNESDLTYVMAGLPQTSEGKVLRSEGKIMSTAVWENNKSALDFFVEDYNVTDNYQQVKGLFRAAIMHRDKIIVKRGVEWVLDKKDGTVLSLGIQDEEVVNYLRNDAPVLSYIREKIGFTSPIIPDLDSEQPITDKPNSESVVELKELAKQFNIPHYQQKGIERLKKELKEKGVVLPNLVS